MDKENKIFKPKTPYLYNIGEIINNMEILEQTYCIYKNEARGKAYKVKCLKCRSITTKTEHQLKDNSGCGVCHGRIVIKGINDIATTHPHLVKYFKNPNDAYNVTYSSSKKVDIICPICGKTEKKNECLQFK